MIAAALGSVVLKATVNLNAKDLQKFGEQYERERFQAREERVRLRTRFEELIQKAIQRSLPAAEGWSFYRRP